MPNTEEWDRMLAETKANNARLFEQIDREVERDMARRSLWRRLRVFLGFGRPSDESDKAG